MTTAFHRGMAVLQSCAAPPPHMAVFKGLPTAFLLPQVVPPKRIPSTVVPGCMEASTHPQEAHRALIARTMRDAMPPRSVAMPLQSCSEFHSILSENPALERWATFRLGRDNVRPVLEWHGIGMNDLVSLPSTERELLVLDVLLHKDARHRRVVGPSRLHRMARSSRHFKRGVARRRRPTGSTARRAAKDMRIETDAQIQDNNDYEWLYCGTAKLHDAILQRGRSLLHTLRASAEAAQSCCKDQVPKAEMVCCA